MKLHGSISKIFLNTKMKRDSINYSISEGFMKAAEYRMELYNYFGKYMESFGEAESLEIYIDELPYSALSLKRKEPFIFSEDGKMIKLYFTTQKYYDTNGRVTSLPTPNDFYQSLESFMKRAIEEYKKKFN